MIMINKQVPDMWKWFTDEDGFVDKLYEENWSSSTVAFLCSNNISVISTMDERSHFLDCPNGIDNDADDNTVYFRYNTGEMNFLCPGMTAKDCVVDSKGRNSCDGPCKLLRLKDRKTMLFCGLIKKLN